MKDWISAGCLAVYRLPRPAEARGRSLASPLEVSIEEETDVGTNNLRSSHSARWSALSSLALRFRASSGATGIATYPSRSA
jgi:hypothetical protein